MLRLILDDRPRREQPRFCIGTFGCVMNSAKIHHFLSTYAGYDYSSHNNKIELLPSRVVTGYEVSITQETELYAPPVL